MLLHLSSAWGLGVDGWSELDFLLKKIQYLLLSKINKNHN
jgi:hypothetical protein